MAAERPDISQQVRRVAKRHGQTLKRMAEELGFTYQDLQNGIRGRSQRMQARVVKEIRASYGLAPNWPDANAVELGPTSLIEVPLVGLASAGPGGPSEGQGTASVPVSMVREDSRAWAATGDSMMPWIEPGDVIVARPSKVPELNRAMLVRTPEGEVRVKIVVFKEGGFWLRSLNPKYPDEPAEVEILGKVTGRYRLRGSHESIENDPVNGIAPTFL